MVEMYIDQFAKLTDVSEQDLNYYEDEYWNSEFNRTPASKETADMYLELSVTQILEWAKSHGLTKAETINYLAYELACNPGRFIADWIEYE
jgi:DNA-binding transcriptional MerR regulator